MFFFFNDTATTEIYTLSLHDALPIFEHDELRLAPAKRCDEQLRRQGREARAGRLRDGVGLGDQRRRGREDRKSTRLNSSHANISYAVFCLKKKKKYTSHFLPSVIATR